MRKLTGFILCCIMIVYSSVAALANTSYNQSEKEEIILQEYLVDDSDIVFSMELFNKTYSREDVADMLKVEKAKENPATKDFRSVIVTEDEIDEVYNNMEKIASRAPSINYYFSRVYWRFRYDAHYKKDIITLTLVPTNVTKNNSDLEITMASWALVKAECGNSQYWTNEGSLEQQFRCHALGETFYPGDVGDWDLEPIRPNVGLIEYAINKCNPV